MLEQFNTLLTSFNSAEFHWLRPQALWLLLSLPLIAVLLYKKRGDNKEWHKVCDPELLPYVVERHNSEDKKLSWLWPLLLGLPAIVALAGPVWERVPQPVFDETAALVILLDTSRSMDAEDIKPSRMQRAKLKVLDILQQRNTGQTALIAYAAEPFVVSPLTTDAKTIAALVPSLSTDIMPQQGSNVSRAIEKAVELLNNAGARGNILLLSDGAQGQNVSAAINAAQQAQARISVIGIGSDNGAPIPSAGGFIKDKQGNIVVVKQETSSLRKLASQGHGNYSNMTAGDADMLTTLSNSTPLENQLQSTELQADQWLEQGPWLLLPLLFLASLLFRRGVLSIALLSPLLLSSLSYSPSTQASETVADSWEWRDLFRNSEQKAAARFQQEQYDDSAQRFDDPQWKASAQYRAEDYAGAIESLSDIDNAEAHYNRGNALAKLGKTKQAIEAYDSALAHDAEHEDALYNKALLEKQQEQQSDQNQDGEKSDEQQDSEKSDQEQSDQQQSDQEQSDQSQSEAENSEQQNSEEQQSQDQQPSEEQQEGEEGEQSEEQEGQEPEDKAAEQQAEQEAKEQELEKQYEDKTQQEVEQATQQWLRRIPDKPGNLLRNQFENEFRRRQQANPNQYSEDRPW